ncbi:beta-1,3-galactosyl-O-glycosyl-glycoprotein beta-1,6-N-acetylglucosaminyltransferase 3-like [Argonauta hians]
MIRVCRRFRCRNVFILLAVIFCFRLWISKMYWRDTDKTFLQDHMKRTLENFTERIDGLSTSSSTYSYQIRPINCDKIFRGDKEEIKRSSKIGINSTLYQRHFLQEFKNYKTIYKSSKYIFNVSEEEKQFPIAFSILFYKDFYQVERLLRVIYRPSNIYCLHIDAKSSKYLQNNIKNLASCFDNVFIASKLEDVVYAGFSRLQADLNCMSDLLKTNINWKYFINLPSQAYPLRTNLELVKILKIYNGSNDIEGITGARALSYRYKYVHKIVTTKGKKSVQNTYKVKPPPPHNITIVKGSVYGVFSRDFVKFVQNDERVQDFKVWLKDIFSPDEYIWATLHHTKLNQHLQTPGGYKGDPDKKLWLATYANWFREEPCSGILVRGICVFGVGDIPNLIKKKQLFVNKFYLNLQPVAMDCMEEWYFRQVRSPFKLDLDFYRNLPFVNS